MRLRERESRSGNTSSDELSKVSPGSCAQETPKTPFSTAPGAIPCPTSVSKAVQILPASKDRFSVQSRVYLGIIRSFQSNQKLFLPRPSNSKDPSLSEVNCFIIKGFLRCLRRVPALLLCIMYGEIILIISLQEQTFPSPIQVSLLLLFWGL